MFVALNYDLKLRRFKRVNGDFQMAMDQRTKTTCQVPRLTNENEKF